MGLFSIPVLAPLVVRTFVADRVTRMLQIRDGIPADQLHHSATYKTDAANSLKVYRANYFRASRPPGATTTSTCRCSSSSTPRIRSCGPTSTTTPTIGCRGCGAATSTPATGRRCRTRRRSRSRCTELVDHLEGKPPSRALLRAQVGRPREYFGDTLVSVTGAGSGIGRETALAFARRGRRSGGQRHRRGAASRTPPRRSPPAAESRMPTPSTSPTPTPSSSSPSRSAPSTVCPTSW